MKIKASEARNLLKCIRFILAHYFAMDTNWQKLRFQIADNLCNMYESPEKFNGSDSALKALRYGRRAMMNYGELQSMYIAEKGFQKRGFVLYKMYPKFHQLIHCLLEIKKSGNPMLNWCYCDESEIGAATKVAESLHPSTLHRNLIKRHRLS